MRTRLNSQDPIGVTTVVGDEPKMTFEDEVPHDQSNTVNNSGVGFTDCSDDNDLDALVNKTLQKFATSKFHSKAKACSALHNRLISSGKLSETKILTVKGMIEKQNWKTANVVETAQATSTLYDSKNDVAAPLKPDKIIKPETVGKGWFDFQPLVIDEKIKRDMKMIQMRNYLDPKRFYKNPDKMGKVLHVGTVIEGPSEYFSSRLSRKERKQTIVEEILGDRTLKDYSKRKYSEIQIEKSSKKKTFKSKKGKK